MAVALTAVLLAGFVLAPRIAQEFDRHPLVMIGELHRWAELHAFLRELARDPAFICRVDDVVVEFGNSRLQEIADAWGAGANMSEAKLQSMWRETAVPLTWNSPLYRQFYETIREVNRNRVCPRPVRIVLGDGPLDWSRIKTASDFAPWGDRDSAIAATIEREVLAKHHRAFVLAGLAHAVKRGAPDGPSTAELIERRHPGAVFSIVPLRTAADAESVQMGPPPSLAWIQGSGFEQADFRLVWKGEPERKWPPMGEVADALLYVGAQQTLVYPDPSIYLEPAYQKELRRRAAIIKEYSGQDFAAAIDALVDDARRVRSR